MLRILVLLQLWVLAFAASKPPTEDTFKDLKWYCSTICDGCGGKSVFNFEAPACICTVNDDVSKDDIELIKKTSGTVGMTMWLQSPKKVIKRDTEETSTKFALGMLAPLRFKLRSRFLKTNGTDGEPLLGQISPLHAGDIIHNGLSAFPVQMRDRNLPVATNHQNHMHSAVTKALLRSAKTKLDGLIDRMENLPYDHHRAAMEVQHIKDSLKQITNLNANFRSAGTSTKFLDNLAHLMPGRRSMLGQVAPNETTTDVSTATGAISAMVSITPGADGSHEMEVPEVNLQKIITHGNTMVSITPGADGSHEMEVPEVNHQKIITQPQEFMEDEEDNPSE